MRHGDKETPDSKDSVSIFKIVGVLLGHQNDLF